MGSLSAMTGGQAGWMNMASLPTMDKLPSAFEGFGVSNRLSDPLVVNLGELGQFYMPDPAAIAADFWRMDEGTQAEILKGYGMTEGMSPSSALERMRMFTPQGTAVQGQTARLA